jgi:hypothetical protein
MDRFLVLGVMAGGLLAWGVLWRLIHLSMSWHRRIWSASLYAAVGAVLFYALQRCEDPVAAWIMATLYGSAALLALTINDPILQLMQRVAEAEARNRTD